MDCGVEVWFAARRTGVWNSVTMFGADMAETQTAIAVRLGQPPATLRPRVGQHSGGVQVLDPPGPGEFVHVGGDAVDDRRHPRQVDGHDGLVSASRRPGAG
jgi:hypothetical protein